MTRARTLRVFREDDRLWASGEARRFAAELGYGAHDQARLALAVAELASNAAKYAGAGRIELREVVDPEPMVQVRAVDDGPGIADVTTAIDDGVSEGRRLTPDVPATMRRGLGVGLGAVGRLLADVRLSSTPGLGLVVEAVLRRRPA